MNGRKIGFSIHWVETREGGGGMEDRQFCLVDIFLKAVPEDVL